MANDKPVTSYTPGPSSQTSLFEPASRLWEKRPGFFYWNPPEDSYFSDPVVTTGLKMLKVGLVIGAVGAMLIPFAPTNPLLFSATLALLITGALITFMGLAVMVTGAIMNACGGAEPEDNVKKFSC